MFAMSNEEARDRIQLHLNWLVHDGEYSQDNVLAQADRVAIQALNKQIPRKPLETKMHFFGSANTAVLRVINDYQNGINHIIASVVSLCHGNR